MALSQAEVDAQPEREVSLRVALDVKAVWIREAARVAIRRGVARKHDRTGGELDARQLDVARRLPEQKLDRRGKAERLFDQVRDQRRVGLDACQLIGVVQ